MVRSLTGLCAVWAVLCPAYVVAADIEVPLTYRPHPEFSPDMPPGFYPGGGAGLQWELNPPVGSWKLPEVPQPALYATIKLGDAQHPLIVTLQTPNSSFFDRLYFDLNANGDLTDDAPAAATVDKMDSGYRAKFPILDTTAPASGTALPYRFSLEICTWAWDGKMALTQFVKEALDDIQGYLRAECSYGGSFSVADRRFQVVLSDSNANGAFDERLRLNDWSDPDPEPEYHPGDRLYLSLSDIPNYSEGWTLGDLLVLDDQALDVSIDIPGGRMMLRPTDQALYPIAFAQEPERIALRTKDAAHVAMLFRPGKEARIPAGEYRLVNYMLLKKEPAGGAWMLCAVSTKDTATVVVGPDKAAKLDMGEPFMPIVYVPAWSLGNLKSGLPEAQLTFSAQGQGREAITELSLLSGKTKIALSSKYNDRPKEPAYRVVAPDGEVVTQGSFEYG